MQRRCRSNSRRNAYNARTTPLTCELLHASIGNDSNAYRIVIGPPTALSRWSSAAIPFHPDVEMLDKRSTVLDLIALVILLHAINIIAEFSSVDKASHRAVYAARACRRPTQQ
ncbi:hypothetical protein EKO27_g6776 [Xylaria grammica]|uniref:Uncharacterized protein n=1 Tax=Xylaria grammica TaxID=363999 RepID=A0A439D1N1_9PEZI|nr:hypothetical protein EKO27_g6776 [Xylaria grammica]